ncbi:MAG: hypothetical protein K2O88_06740 [Paramuribaculum sp.]|nr:hypothetical protein [Paramuribaculum sp.]
MGCTIICDHCGKEATEGYLFPDDDTWYCDDECMLNGAYYGDFKRMEADRKLVGTNNEVYFYTTTE